NLRVRQRHFRQSRAILLLSAHGSCCCSSNHEPDNHSAHALHFCCTSCAESYLHKTVDSTTGMSTNPVTPHLKVSCATDPVPGATHRGGSTSASTNAGFPIAWNSSSSAVDSPDSRQLLASRDSLRKSLSLCSKLKSLVTGLAGALVGWPSPD